MMKDIERKTFKKFRDWFKKGASPFEYEHPLSLEDKTLIKLTAETVMESVLKEIERHKRVCKHHCDILVIDIKDLVK